jgi:hypothetical protein
MAKKAAEKPKGAVSLSAEEVEAIAPILSYGLEADVVRPPYKDALASALEKLGLIEEEEGPELEAAPMAQRLPVRAQ